MVGVIWLVNPAVIKRRKLLSWPLFASSIFVAFMAGVLVTVLATGEVPNVTVKWGSLGPADCAALLDGSRLLSFKKKYDVGLVCGIVDSSIDKLADTAITVSQPFTIVPGEIEISASGSDALVKKLQSGHFTERWLKAVLLPKGLDVTKIASLNDVKKAGGKVISPGYWED